MRYISVFLVALLATDPAFADVYRYEFEEAVLTIEEEPYECGRAAAGELRHPFPGLYDDPEGLQRLVRGVAEARRADCGLTQVLDLRLYGSEHVSEITVFANDYWQLPDLRRSDALTAEEEAAAAKRLAAIMAMPPNKDHPLAYRGWARSELLHEEDAFSLYAAFDSRDSDRAELVMVITDPGGPFIDTAVQQMERNNLTIVPGPEYFEWLDRALAEAGPPYWRNNLIRHYLGGYYIDGYRDQILANDGAVEQAFHRMNYGRYWDGTRMRVTPIPMMYLGYESSPEELLIDRERIEIAHGPSGPGPDGTGAETVAALPEQPDDGYLPEGPSAQRTYRRRLVREATIERGLIFLNDGFWAQFSSSDVQRVFESHAEYLSVGDPGFSALVLHYLDRNGRQCAQTIDRPTQWKLKEITVETDGFGNASSSETTIWDMTVPARFVPHLDRWFNAPNPSATETIGAAVASMRPGGLGSLAGDIAEDRLEVEETIGDVERIMALGECGNAFQVQLEEMLYLQVAGLNPEEATSLTLPEASRVVMELYVPGEAHNVKTACLAADDFLGKRSDWRRCGCIERQLSQRLPAALDTYSARFQSLFPQVKAIRDDPSRRGPEDRALADSWYSCLN